MGPLIKGGGGVGKIRTGGSGYPYCFTSYPYSTKDDVGCSPYARRNMTLRELKDDFNTLQRSTFNSTVDYELDIAFLNKAIADRKARDIPSDYDGQFNQHSNSTMKQIDLKLMECTEDVFETYEEYQVDLQDLQIQKQFLELENQSLLHEGQKTASDSDSTSDDDGTVPTLTIDKTLKLGKILFSLIRTVKQ